jgi:hypothetical protein
LAPLLFLEKDLAAETDLVPFDADTLDETPE